MSVNKPKMNIKSFIKDCLGIIPPSYRLGRNYRNMLGFLAEAQWWDRVRIETWQFEKLQQLLKYAYKNVPGYYSLYKDAGIVPEDIRSLEDIKLLPCLTKEILRDNLSLFTSMASSKWGQVYTTTSGSTGVPVGFYHSRVSRNIEKAFIHSSWSRAGWNPNDISAVLRGAFVGSPEEFWKYDAYDRTLLLSSYYLTEQTYYGFRDKILQYIPRALQAYPSSATILADLVTTFADTTKIHFDIILLGSENLYPWQKDKILAAFRDSKLFAWYGHAEQAILATMCEYSDHYHLWPYYGLTEIANENGVEVDNGEMGELIGTSFWNYVTPFIRYRTRDLARKGRNRCADCKREFVQLDFIEGRLQEFIVTQLGRRISIAALNMHSDIFDNVKQFQFHQKIPGKIRLKIVPQNRYTERDTKRIRFEILKKLGPDMELDFDFVERIPQAVGGKYLFLKQELELKYGA